MSGNSCQGTKKSQVSVINVKSKFYLHKLRYNVPVPLGEPAYDYLGLNFPLPLLPDAVTAIIP